MNGHDNESVSGNSEWDCLTSRALHVVKSTRVVRHWKSGIETWPAQLSKKGAAAAASGNTLKSKLYNQEATKGKHLWTINRVAQDDKWSSPHKKQQQLRHSKQPSTLAWWTRGIQETGHFHFLFIEMVKYSNLWSHFWTIIPTLAPLPSTSTKAERAMI